MQAGSIGKLHEIIARSHVIIPDLETPYPDSNMAFEINNQSINAIIAQRQQQLDAALHEISSLETVIDCITDLHRQLVEKKEKITQSMDSHKRLVSALWRLPNEILSQIFIFCLPEIHKVFPGPASKLVSPMLLTRVCQRWREVAINMPSLWCKLRLDLDRNSRRKWQQQAFYYDTWLRQSQARPLLLVVQCYAGDMAKIRNLLQPYGNQVSSLNIPFLVGIDKLLENLPTLQELILHRTAGAGSHPPTLAKSISRLPITVRSLKVLRLSFSASDFSIFSPVLARLTHLELSLFRLNEVFELLQLCPNLSSLLL
ncbi:hypothetical protein DEU56DRAFT_855425, partial [Suillus clintonianus]|uniref:uncharacterized protein n=1 Tax=Suillus clintonianus TaxID=1904413 RepID=UPI001B87BCC2